jgi:hypothetical protein
MRVDSSGRLGVGTSSPAETLHVQKTSAAYILAEATTAANSGYRLKNTQRDWYVLNDSTGKFSLYDDTATATRLTVDTSGRIGVGTTTPETYLAGVFGQVIAGSSSGQAYYSATNNQTWLTFIDTAGAWYEWYNVSSSRTEAYITTSGAMYNRSGTYGTISDVRYKQDIVDSGSQWDDIKALQVKKYRMIDDVNADPENAPVMLGVIAQDLEEAGMSGLVEEAAHKTTDEGGNIVDTGETRKTVKYSILYMKAVKALQEAMARIEALEAEVAALKEAAQ